MNEQEHAVRLIAAQLIAAGANTVYYANKWNAEESERAANYREQLTDNLVALIANDGGN